MRSLGPSVVVVVSVLVCAPARAQADPVAQARAALDAIDVEAGRLKRGENQPANALLQRTHQVRTALYNAVGAANAAWAVELKRCEALDRRIQEAATGQPVAAPAPDEPTRRATALLDEVERGLAALNPGEGAAATALLTKVEEAKQAAVGAQVRRNDAWVDVFPRAFDLERRVRARYAEQPGAAAAPQGPPAPGQRPPAAPRPLSATDGWALRKDFYPVWDDVTDQLGRMDPADMGLSRFAERFRDGVRRMLAAITAVQEQRHPDVQWCRQRLAAWNELLEAKIREGIAIQQQRARDAAAAVLDVNARLAQLREVFDPATLSCRLEPPYSTERVAAWIADRKRLRQVAATGQAEMEEIRARYPDYAKDPAVDDMHRRFQRWLPNQLAQALTDATGWVDGGARRAGPGRLGELVAAGEGQLTVDLSEANLGDDAWVAGVLLALRDGAQAADALRQIARDDLGKDDPALAQKATRLRAFAAQVEERGLKALAGARMPAAASTDARLIALARECLTNPEYGAGPYERLVVTSTPTRQTAKRSDSWVEGNYLYTRTWTEEWEELQVVLAEKVGEHHRLVTYVLKYVHRSAGMKPEGRWYCHQRWEGQRILPENIAK